MDTAGYYLPKDALRITGVSASTLRNYTRDFVRYLSTEATTVPRKFSAEDLKLLAFIRYRTDEKRETISQVQTLLDAGALADFAWDAPPLSVAPTMQAQSDVTEYLVPMAQMQAAQALMLDAQQREQQATTRERELQARIEDLQRQVGELSGELKAVKASRRQAPKWWRTVFGGRAEV